jgi:CheY-like chemotaxis protein
MNILLVEDNQADVKIALRAFAGSKLKNEIYVVNDGEEALAFIFHEGKYQDKAKFPTPDLILLDIKMPKIDGFHVLETLKQNLEYGYIPVIMFTSSKNEEDIVKSYKKGAASYIAKPVDYEEFVKIVDEFNRYWHVINKLPPSDMNK